MKIILFGLPISLNRRLKQESQEWNEAVPAGHGFRAVPLSSNSLGGFTKTELAELLDAVSDGFTHVVIPANRNWAEITKLFRFDCRVHVARLRDPLKDLTWPILKEALHRIARMDEIWLESICPKDLRHPLLLPPVVFATNNATADYWRQCDVYSKERFAYAERVLTEVERHHRRPDGNGVRSWLDSRNRRYRNDPSQHGRSTADRGQRKSFRFCYEVPPGFHYDVTDDSGNTFKIEIDGQVKTLKHCNVTPWGQVRGD